MTDDKSKITLKLQMINFLQQMGRRWEESLS